MVFVCLGFFLLGLGFLFFFFVNSLEISRLLQLYFLFHILYFFNTIYDAKSMVCYLILPSIYISLFLSGFK